MTDPTIKRIETLLRKPGVIFGAGAAILLLVTALLALAFPLYKPLLSAQFPFSMIVLAVMLALILSATAVCILAERKIAGFTQDRYGPNRVGFWGLLQPLADGLKFLLKEDIIPRHVDKPLFLLAPALALAASLLGFAIIPWAGQVRWPWMPPDAPPLSTQVANLNVGFLYLLAVGSLSVYGVVLAGYASNNKYAFYGGMRAAAQIISYELPLGLGLLVVLLVSGTLQLDQIVQQQAATGVWNIFLHPVAFFLVLVSALAEANRAPFDLPEAEQELVGGYHTEYSAMKFAMFFLGEYVHMITSSALMVALFFGGWHVWGLPGLENVTWWAMLVKLVAYLTKVALFIALFMLVRWTLPRFRFDQLMRVAWQSLVPIGVALLAATAVLTYLGWQHNVWASLAANLLLLVVLLRSAARSKRPVTARQDDLPEVDVRPTA
jgi:NADH-quinone oxidoreductase subunit H